MRRQEGSLGDSIPAREGVQMLAEALRGHVVLQDAQHRVVAGDGAHQGVEAGEVDGARHRARMAGRRLHHGQVLGHSRLVHEDLQVQHLSAAVQRLDRGRGQLVPARAVGARALRDAEAPEVARQRRLRHVDAAAPECFRQLLLAGEAAAREHPGDRGQPARARHRWKPGSSRPNARPAFVFDPAAPAPCPGGVNKYAGPRINTRPAPHCKRNPPRAGNDRGPGRVRTGPAAGGTGLAAWSRPRYWITATFIRRTCPPCVSRSMYTPGRTAWRSSSRTWWRPADSPERSRDATRRPARSSSSSEPRAPETASENDTVRSCRGGFGCAPSSASTGTSSPTPSCGGSCTSKSALLASANCAAWLSTTRKRACVVHGAVTV